MCALLDLSPDDPRSLKFRRKALADWWNELRICGDPGAATWEELEHLEQQVTDCLAKQVPDATRAESLTAYALLLITGCTEL